VKKKSAPKFLVGIDEVGRGPLAGPVAVGVAMATTAVIGKFKKIKESKQLSLKQREEWYAHIVASGDVSFAVTFVSAALVDKNGINPSIRTALRRALKKVGSDPKSSRVLLDGGLRAPNEYVDQETIIRGDAKETIIAIASVVAKVTRDRHMQKLHVRHPKYGFDRHVGYGTAKHIAAIKKYGMSPEHRRTCSCSLSSYVHHEGARYMRTVIMEVERNGAVAIEGLTADEEDDLYEELEKKFGKDEISATVGCPYRVSVIGEESEDVYRFIRSHCERHGWNVTT
jgi:ribonuclease HII